MPSTRAVKSSPKRARGEAAAPTPTRRTPRQSAGTTPTRLGFDDQWGNTPAGEWKSDAEAAKAREEKLSAERAVRVAEHNAEMDKKRGKVDLLVTYGNLMEKRRLEMSLIQSAILASAGEFLHTTMIKEEEVNQKQLLLLFGWGLLQMLVVLPYLHTFNSLKIVKDNVNFDSLCKAVLSAVTMTPFMMLLFQCYSDAIMQGQIQIKIDQDFLLNRWKLFAGFGLLSDICMFSMVPARFQPICAILISTISAITVQ